MTEKKEKEAQKCVHLGCEEDATWKGMSTKQSIEKVPVENVKLDVRPLFRVGKWHYCDKHKEIIAGYNPHLQFEKL